MQGCGALNGKKKSCKLKWKRQKSWKEQNGVLIEHLSMDEASAHRYIEKQAMDMRMTKLSIAESILKTYES